MHIVLVSRLSGHGGVAVYNRTLADALVSLGHQVSILTARGAADTPAEEQHNGITTYRLLTRHSARLHRLPVVGAYLRSILQLAYSLRVAAQLKRIHRIHPVDVIEFAEVGGEAFWYLRQRRRAPVVVRCHTPTFILREYHLPAEMPYNTRLTAWMEKDAIRRAQALTAPSRDMAETIAQHCQLAPERIQVIPNAVDVEAYQRHSEPRQVPGAASGALTVLHVGRFERIKGIAVLAQAIPRVLAALPQVRFVFIGAGRSDHQAQQWREQLEQNGHGRVEILGFLSQAELLTWYQKADLAVVPSINYESFSYTCAQAMAAGLPVVASQIGGIPETLGMGAYGRLVKPGDPAELAAAIIALCQQPELLAQIGQAAQHYAQTAFAAPIVAAQCLDLYQQYAR